MESGYVGVLATPLLNYRLLSDIEYIYGIVIHPDKYVIT